MRLLTFYAEQREQWGILVASPSTGERFALIPQKFQALMQTICSPTSSFFFQEREFWPGNHWPDTLVGFLYHEQEGMARLKKLCDFAVRYLAEQDEGFLEACAYPLDSIQVKAPIPEPRLYWGLVQNTTSFIRNQPQRCHANLYPQGHQRPLTCAVGAGEAVVLRPDDHRIYFNLELGVVIGKKGRDIPAEHAMEYVAGYTNVLDCARMQLFRDYNCEERRDDWDFFTAATASWGGKKTDTSCPMGPWLITKEEVFNPYHLLGYTRRNGLVRDCAHTSALMLGIERTIAFYSSFATLYPGDVIHLGTIGVDGITVDVPDKDADLGTLEGEFEAFDPLTVPLVREKALWSSANPPASSKPASPIVENRIAQGQDVLPSPHAFDCRRSHNFWVSYGNYRQCLEQEELRQIADMPRFLNNPASALGDTGQCSVAHRATNLVLSAELCFVVKKVAYQVTPEEAPDFILGYSPMAAVSDQSIQEQIVEPATDQERCLPVVYARWGDGYNQLLETPIPWEWNPRAAMHLTVNGREYHCSVGDYLCSGPYLLSRISQYITLLPGDVITLGRLAETVLIPTGEEARGTLAIDGLGQVRFSFARPL